jgi:hypothetical protein
MSKILVRLALPALVAAAVVYQRATHCCGSAAPPSVAAADLAASEDDAADGPVCCAERPKSRCRACASAFVGASEEAGAEEPTAEPAKAAKPADPDREVVFRAQGLTCPAVKGIGCGHMLFPILTGLDKLDGVAASSANYTGTLVRVSLAPGADRAKVAAAARKALAEDAGEVAPLTGDDLRRALEREHWRGAGRIGELSAIEFKAMALYRIRKFIAAEKLDQATADKLVGIAEGQWEQVTKEAAAAGKSTTPVEWGRRCKQAMPTVLAEAKGVLTAEQVERLKEALATPCRGEDRPEAPSEQPTTAGR